MEYDAWQSIPLRQTGPASYAGEITLPGRPRMVQAVSVHQHKAAASTLTVSSPLVQVECR